MSKAKIMELLDLTEADFEPKPDPRDAVAELGDAVAELSVFVSDNATDTEDVTDAIAELSEIVSSMADAIAELSEIVSNPMEVE